MRAITRLLVLIVFLVAVASSMCIACSSCGVRDYSIDESQNNFREYGKRLADIASGYGLQLCEVESSYIDDPEDKSVEAKFRISIDEDIRIEIYFSNMPGRHQKDRERFSISYIKNQHANDFDVDLFVSLISSISSRTVSSDYCKEFLNAPEEKYTASAYSKLNGEKVVKYSHLDFFENWRLWYFLKENDSEELTFDGLTR